jgi:hypothetical protein
VWQMLRAVVLELVDERACILYTEFKRVWPTTARDFCLLQYHSAFANGTEVICYSSVEVRPLPRPVLSLGGPVPSCLKYVL